MEPDAAALTHSLFYHYSWVEKYSTSAASPPFLLPCNQVAKWINHLEDQRTIVRSAR
jgi:hypothetical protein